MSVRFLPPTEQELREQIAQEIEYRFLPICICERCGNLREGYLVRSILETIKGDKSGSSIVNS